MNPAPEKPSRAGNPAIDFLVALQFLTVAPPVIRRMFTPDELGRATAYFPLVGAVVGVVLMGAHWLLGLAFPPAVQAALTLVVWTGLSGALHLDGFLDACDGLLGGFTPESRLQIMRDERVGAFALAGGLLLFLVKFAALASLPRAFPALLVAPVLGRWAMAVAIVIFPYARPEGLGKALKDHAGRLQSLIASILALAIAGGTAGGIGLVTGLVAAGVTWAGAAFTLRRIPGLTGDIYGALNELVETTVLLVFVSRWAL